MASSGNATDAPRASADVEDSGDAAPDDNRFRFDPAALRRELTSRHPETAEAIDRLMSVLEQIIVPGELAVLQQLGVGNPHEDGTLARVLRHPDATVREYGIAVYATLDALRDLVERVYEGNAALAALAALDVERLSRSKELKARDASKALARLAAGRRGGRTAQARASHAEWAQWQEIADDIVRRRRANNLPRLSGAAHLATLVAGELEARGLRVRSGNTIRLRIKYTSAK